jgi:hypothetical protein
MEQFKFLIKTDAGTEINIPCEIVLGILIGTGIILLIKAAKGIL